MKKTTFNENHFKKLRIAIIGDLIVDRYISGTIDRKNPESAAPLVNVESIRRVLGGAWNVRECLWRLGVEALSFHCQDISPGGKNPPVPVKTRIIVDHQQIVRYDREDVFPISPELQENIVKSVRRRKPDAIIVSDYAKGTITGNYLDQLLDFPMYIDAHPANYSLYPTAAVLKMNRRELRKITGLDDPLAGIDVIKKDQKAIIITGGERETIYTDNCRPMAQAPAHKRKVYDVTGAGDVFMAAFVAAYTATKLLSSSVEFANYVAGLSVEKIGSYHPKWDEINRGQCDE